MDLRKFEADASASPPSAPVSPSTGYASPGNPGSGTPASKPGAYFFHQMAEELRNLIVGANLTPDMNDLTQLLQAIKAFAPILPLAALPYPTVATSNNLVGATVANEAGTGGKVSIPANVRISLGQEVTVGQTGRQRMATTAAWTSASLAVSSTYYLRAYLDSSGVFVPYVQKGTDTDSIPGGLVGTPNGGSGGGFDTTVLDVLLAKIVTGIANSVPTLTQLANAALLSGRMNANGTATHVSNFTYEFTQDFTINWARSPKMVEMYGIVSQGGAALVNGGANYQRTLTWTRYLVTTVIRTDFDVAPTTPLGAIEVQPLA